MFASVAMAPKPHRGKTEANQAARAEAEAKDHHETEAEKIAHQLEQAHIEKVAAEKAATEKAAEEKAAKDKAAAEKAAAEKAAEKAAAEKEAAAKTACPPDLFPVLCKDLGCQPGFHLKLQVSVCRCMCAKDTDGDADGDAELEQPVSRRSGGGSSRLVGASSEGSRAATKGLGDAASIGAERALLP